MKTRKKMLLLTLSAILLVIATVFTTVAYLTSQDEVVNTFTVGKVEIKLDEAKANTDGTLVEGATRVQKNTYHLLPGHSYEKDPMVTVLKGSESSYVRMMVTISKSDELDAIFTAGTVLNTLFIGYDGTNWIYKGNVKDTVANTRTYEFWYKEAVGAPGVDDVALDALFDRITVPSTINNEQLASIKGMTITVNAHAIQADGFGNAAAAWAAFPVTP